MTIRDINPAMAATLRFHLNSTPWLALLVIAYTTSCVVLDTMAFLADSSTRRLMDTLAVFWRRLSNNLDGVGKVMIELT